MFHVEAPVSPMLVFVAVDGEDAIYHKIVYDDDCDDFKVVEVIKFNVLTWERSN